MEAENRGLRERERESRNEIRYMGWCDVASPHGWGLPLEAGSKERWSPWWAQLHQRYNNYRMETTNLYPCYHIRDIQSLKDKQIECNVHQPMSKGTIIKEMTLKIKNNQQHNTSLPTTISKPPWLRIMGYGKNKISNKQQCPYKYLPQRNSKWIK